MSLGRLEDVAFDPSKVYDLAIVTCGYESRSSFLARSGLRGTAQIAVQHGEVPGLAFDSNKALLLRAGWEVASDTDVLRKLRSMIHGENVSIAVDISSMPRRFLANLVELFTELSGRFAVDWFYAPAEFDASSSVASTIQPLVANPVSEFFGGAIRSPLLPVGLIVGLGLEPHRAMGLMEFLEPSRVWALVGQSDEPRFAAAAIEVNRELLELPTTTLLRYPVASLTGTFSSLESLVFATQDAYRLVIAPSGPKMFGLAAMLAGAVAGDLRPAVWRVGGHGDTVALDVAESGVIVGSRSWWGHPNHGEM